MDLNTCHLDGKYLYSDLLDEEYEHSDGVLEIGE
jgi:hypothetical protein